jgi:hypothetical protein
MTTINGAAQELKAALQFYFHWRNDEKSHSIINNF